MLKVTSIEAFNSKKVLEFSAAIKLIAKLRSENKKVGLCHGGFDLLHPGHIIHFESAKKLCDILFVSLTSDRFVSDRKGSGRPVFPDRLRAYAAASLECVDYSVVTDFAKGTEIIELLKPSYYIKGPDYINKTTPGITAEREAIAKVGGEMIYTNDPTLSTTEIIQYIKNEMDIENVLLIVDRDGTIIENDDFLGKNDDWMNEMKLNEPVVNYLSYLQTKYRTTKIVVTNQAGVARGYYDEQTVERINSHLHSILQKKGIKIESWRYCPDVDSKYAELKKKELSFLPKFVKDKTKRKPSPEMVMEALKDIKKDIIDFHHIIVIGDRDEDKQLAENLKARFIDVKGKSYQELIKIQI